MKKFTILALVSILFINYPVKHYVYADDDMEINLDEDYASDDNVDASEVTGDSNDDSSKDSSKDSKGPDLPINVSVGYTVQKSRANGTNHGTRMGLGMRDENYHVDASGAYYPSKGFDFEAGLGADGALVKRPSGFQLRAGVLGYARLAALKDKTFSGSAKLFVAPSFKPTDNSTIGLNANLGLMCAEDMRDDNKSCDEMGTVAGGMGPFLRVDGKKLKLDVSGEIADSLITDGKISTILLGNADLQLVLKQFADGDNISAYGNFRVEGVKLNKDESTNGTDLATYGGGLPNETERNFMITGGIRYNPGAGKSGGKRK